MTNGISTESAATRVPHVSCGLVSLSCGLESAPPLSSGECCALQAVIAEASLVKGVQEVSLNVCSDNAPALGLYSKIGFLPEPELLWDYYGEGRPAVRMVLPLHHEL